MRSQRLLPTLIEIEPAQIFVESRREFSLVWPAFVLSCDELPSTLVFVWPLQFRNNFWNPTRPQGNTRTKLRYLPILKNGGYASVNSSGAHPPPGISRAFFLIVRPGGRALVYPGAFDSLVFFTSQHYHFLSVISLSGKDDKFVINFV